MLRRAIDREKAIAGQGLPFNPPVPARYTGQNNAALNPASDRDGLDKPLNRQDKPSYRGEATSFATGPLVNVIKT